MARRRLCDRRVEVEREVGHLLCVVNALDVGAGGGADLAPALGPDREQLLEPGAQRLLRGVEQRHVDPVRLARPRHGFVVQEGDHRLAERHRLDREQPVPAGVELVDDDVDVVVERERLLVVEVLDDAQLDVEAVRRPRSRGRCPSAAVTTAHAARSAAARSDGGTGRIAARSMPGGITCASGTQRIAS